VKTFLSFCTLVGAVVFGMVQCEGTEYMKSHRAKAVADEKRKSTPHVIREADGCKVYAWYDGAWHYFTRCSSVVTTERSYTESCGKSCTKKKSEVIVTEGNK
jgi:hypothetical protein